MIEVKQGLIAKSSRRARLDRINTIGVRRPLVPRLLGLAKLDIQAAGNDASVVLEYLPIAVAQDLRRMILAGDVDPAQEQEEEDIQREVEVPLFRYLASLVVSVETVFLVTLITAVSIFAVWAGERALWLTVVLALFVYVVYLGERLIRSGNFVIDSLAGAIGFSGAFIHQRGDNSPRENPFPRAQPAVGLEVIWMVAGERKPCIPAGCHQQQGSRAHGNFACCHHR